MAKKTNKPNSKANRTPETSARATEEHRFVTAGVTFWATTLLMLLLVEFLFAGVVVFSRTREATTNMMGAQVILLFAATALGAIVLLGMPLVVRYGTTKPPQWLLVLATLAALLPFIGMVTS